ncbi:MAG: thioredoxin family protein [Phycisphaerales bacterium]
MPPVASRMVALGTPMPAFSLPDGHGTMHESTATAGPNGQLVMFICNHCPFVIHIAEELARLGQDLPGRGVGVVAIGSNDAARYPDDAPERMPEEAERRGYTFPYLHDADQSVARGFGAECTPDFFLYDGDGRLAYRGQLDAGRPGSDVPVDGADLRAAVDAMLAGQPPLDPQRPSIGCSIKWLEG